MKRIFLLFFSLLLLTGHQPLKAQCGSTNTAFNSGETLTFDLFFNWAFVWIKVGTAKWEVQQTQYKGKPAYRTHLITSTNKRADKFFVMRDTLTAFTSLQLVPWAYNKHAHEGDYFRIDDVRYSYAGGKCTVDMNYIKNGGKDNRSRATYSECVYDMVSMMLRARSYDVSDWRIGTRQYFMMADGRDCNRQSIVYRGKENVKVDRTGDTYRCLVFSFMEKEKNKEKEVVRFFISDDDNHLPIRLDMNLNFGTAKAFLATTSGIRHPQSAIIKRKK